MSWQTIFTGFFGALPTCLKCYLIGIKIGRYTYEKRTQDILERRRFDEQQRQLRLARRRRDDVTTNDDLEVENTSSNYDFQPSQSMADAADGARRAVREVENGYIEEDRLTESSGSLTDEVMPSLIRQMAVGAHQLSFGW